MKPLWIYQHYDLSSLYKSTLTPLLWTSLVFPNSLHFLNKLFKGQLLGIDKRPCYDYNNALLLIHTWSLNLLFIKQIISTELSESIKWILMSKTNTHILKETKIHLKHISIISQKYTAITIFFYDWCVWYSYLDKEKYPDQFTKKKTNTKLN